MVQVASVPSVLTSTGRHRRICSHNYLQDAIGYQALWFGIRFPISVSDLQTVGAMPVLGASTQRKQAPPHLQTQAEELALLRQSQREFHQSVCSVNMAQNQKKSPAQGSWGSKFSPCFLKAVGQSGWVWLWRVRPLLSSYFCPQGPQANHLSVNLGVKWVNDGQLLHRAEAWGHGS